MKTQWRISIVILFKPGKTGYDVFYVIDDEQQFLGNVNKSEVDTLADYYKSFGNEVQIND